MKADKYCQALKILLLILISTKALAKNNFNYGVVKANNNTVEQQTSLEQRLQKCEKVLANLEQLNYSKALATVQEELRECHGQLDELRHLLNIQHQKQVEWQKSVELKLGMSSNPNNLNPKLSYQQEARDYQLITDLIEALDYQSAIKHLEKFLQEYPNSQYLVNAKYWLGDIHLRLLQEDPSLTLHNTEANKAFKYIVNNFSNHPKVSDALLKLGSLAMINNDLARAKAYFVELITRFKNSSAARVAEQKLKQLS